MVRERQDPRRILAHALAVRGHLDASLESFSTLTHLILLASAVLLTAVVFHALHVWRGEVMSTFVHEVQRSPHHDAAFSAAVAEHPLTPTLQMIATLNFLLLAECALRWAFSVLAKQSSRMMMLMGVVGLSACAQACASGLRLYSLAGTELGWALGWPIGGLLINLLVVLMQVASCTELWVMYGDFLALRALRQMLVAKGPEVGLNGTATPLPSLPLPTPAAAYQSEQPHAEVAIKSRGHYKKDK